MKFHFLYLPIFLILSIQNGWSQKVLQLEKSGVLRTKHIYIGDLFIYQLKGLEGEWIEDYVIDLDIENKVIQLNRRSLNLSDLHAIKLVSQDGDFITRKLPAVFIGFSYVWGFWTVVAAIDGAEITKYTIGIPIFSHLLGRTLKLGAERKFKIGKRKRVRMLRLNPIPLTTDP